LSFCCFATVLSAQKVEVCRVTLSVPSKIDLSQAWDATVEVEGLTSGDNVYVLSRLARSNGRLLIQACRQMRRGIYPTLGAAMVTALAPTALSGGRLQRKRALLALTVAAPASAADLAGVLLDTSTSAEEREFARQINMRASLDEIDARFLGHIRVGRKLHQEGFFAVRKFSPD
jgi:hypothetical protein